MAEVLPLTTIGIILVLAMGFSVFIKKLGQNEVIGFILAGFLLGPFWLHFLNPTDPLVTGFAELGLFVLLFYLGIELSLKEFLNSGTAIFGLGLVDMVLTTSIALVVLVVLGYSFLFSLIVAIMLFSTSTAIVAKFILDKNLMGNPAAKISLSILIMQDFTGILLLVFITSLSRAGDSALSLALAALVFAVGAFYAVHRISRIAEEWLKRNGFGHTQITLYALGIGLVVSTLGSFLGLSTAIGAYFAGFALSETRSGKKIKKDMSFLRDFFLVFFFVGFGTTLFFDHAQNAVVLPTPDGFLFLLLLAGGLGTIAILAHSLSTRIFGGFFGLSEQDTSVSAILLSPLGEFVVIIATVSVGVLSGAEAKLLSPLAFLVILLTVIAFQPLYNLRELHRRVFSLIPRIARPIPPGSRFVQNTPYTLVQAKEIGVNLFIVLCFAWLSVLLYYDLPSFGVPIIYSRQITGVALFLFFSTFPLFRIVRAAKRLFRELVHPTHQLTGMV